MSGRVHMVSDAVYWLSALIQHKVLSTEESAELAVLIHQSANNEQIYQKLLYKVRLSHLEHKEDRTASRLWKALYEAVEGSRGQ